MVGPPRSATSIFIGNSRLALDAPVTIDPDKLFGRHVGVFGNTGSGKSCTVAGLIRWSIEAAAEKARSVGARFIILDPNGEYRECFKDLTQFVDVRVFSVEPRPGERELIVPAWMWNGQEWAGAVAASPGTQRPVLMQAIRHLRSYGRQSLTTPQSVSMHLKITSSLKSGERQALA